MPAERVFALVDVDAMYASVEQVLQPWLAERPVVVLSNNDGCVIARNHLAKQRGIQRGQPWAQLARDSRLRQVVARSAHFELYGDFSRRLLALLETHSDQVQPYSIDECYLTLPATGAAERAHQLRAQVGRWLGLPVSIGLGPTHTWAHLATTHAKTLPGSGGSCHAGELGTDGRQALLEATPVAAIWGVAERLATRLSAYGITTAAELAAADPGWARRAFSVTLERTVRELRGIPCLPLETDSSPRQQCLHFRQLGRPVRDRETLAEITTAFAATLARRLRRHHRAATALSVHLAARSAGNVQATQTLTAPTAATLPLAATAAELARRLWRDGQSYSRVGLIAHELTAWPPARPLGEPPTAEGQEALAAALDAITGRYGTTSIGLGRNGLRTSPEWSSRQGHLWPVSTVRWDRLPLLHC